MPEKSQNWSIRGLRGSIPWLKEKINAADDKKFFTGQVEAHWKACLCDALDTLDPQYNVATINAHAQIHDGSTAATPPITVFDLTISPESIGGM